MNKKMRELRQKMQALIKQVEERDPEADAEGVAKLLDEMDELEKSYQLAERAYEASKKAAGEHIDDPTPADGGEKKSTGFAVIAKILRGRALDEDEVSLVTPGEDVAKALVSGNNAANGENYLIPEDVRLEINELRRTYISAKDITTVVPTTSLTGSFNFEAGALSGLTGFDDGDDISGGGEPKFERKPWAVKFYGKIIPVSNILTGAEKAGLMAYLNRWFVKNAIYTENEKVFAALTSGKTPIPLSGWADLKDSINIDLDPSCKNGGVIVTNQSGFAYLDRQLDGNGRPILQPNPANSTDKVFQDMPVMVFPDSQLADVGGEHPVFYGRTADGCWFIEFMSLLFASSAHAGFGKNQTHLRVIQGFDVVGADKEAYQYGLLEADDS